MLAFAGGPEEEVPKGDGRAARFVNLGKGTNMEDMKITRRSFLGLGATAAVVAGAGLAGCAPAAKDDPAKGASAGGDAAAPAANGNPTEFTPSWMNPPEPIDDSTVAETIDVDVCVVGLGLAGVCALREAADSGAKVIGIEKGVDVGYRSGEFGTFGSEIHKQLGIEQPETQEVVNELMKVMGNRPNAQLLNYWIANSGQDLDWYIGSAEHELLTSDSDTPTDPEKPYVFPERCPVNENYNWREENYPCFPGMVHLLPDHGWAMHGTLEAAQAAGAEARFNTKGEQLHQGRRPRGGRVRIRRGRQHHPHQCREGRRAFLRRPVQRHGDAHVLRAPGDQVRLLLQHHGQGRQAGEHG